MKYKSLIFSLFFIMFLIIPSVFAYTFTQTGLTGNWDISTFPNFSYNTNGNTESGRINYTIQEPITILNNTGGYLKFALIVKNIEGNRAQSFWYDGVMRFFYVLDLHKGNEHVYTQFYIAHEDRHGWFWNSSQAKFGTIAFNQDNAQTNNAVYVIELRRMDNTSVTVNYWSTLNYVDNSTAPTPTPNPNGYGIYDIIARLYTTRPYYQQNFTVTNDFWTNATATLYTGYEGVGKFDISFTDLEVGENAQWLQPVDTTSNSLIPQWLLDIFNFGYSMITLVLSIGYMLLRIGLAILPYVPFIGLLYLFDVAITCFKTKSFTPMGEAFKQIYEYILLIGRTLIEIGNTIYQIGASIWNIIGSFFSGFALLL